MKPVKLRDFLEFLNDQTEADFRGDAVDRYLAEHPVDPQDFLPYAYFREDTYGRNLVAKTELYEMLVLTWLPRHRTPIHDHASQRCWMFVNAGTLTFRNYQTPERDTSELVTLGPVETHSAGEGVYIDDQIAVHTIANASQKPAVSVHLYAGPIPRCRIYDETEKRFKWVELQYFTQVGPAWEAPGLGLQ